MKRARSSAVCLLWAGVLLPLSAVSSEPRESRAEKDAYWVFVGTYTEEKHQSKGIYRFELDPATGNLSHRALAAETKNPSFLAIHPNHKYLYAVGELGKFNGQKSGAVSAFAIDPKTGDLTLLNQQPSGGPGPCHVTVDRVGKHVLAANYEGGSACVLPIRSDGGLGEASEVVHHRGSSVNKQRQEAAHAHSINLDAANRFAFVADLGLDKVMIYRYDAEKGKLPANDPPFVAVTPGSGPRHFAFHPDGRHAYVINELASTVTAMDYDPEHGVLKPIQTVSTLPEDSKGENTTAEVQVHPSGKFLYGSNRGHNSIAVFKIDAKTGELTPAGRQGGDIKIPRNFGIDPTGKYLLVANQESDSIVVFRIDPDSGELTPTGAKAEVPMPVCVKMMAIPQ
jgi:6-phosphogluconolactonase